MKMVGTRAMQQKRRRHLILPNGTGYFKGEYVEGAESEASGIPHAFLIEQEFLFAPAGDAGGQEGAIANLCHWLEHDPASPVRRHTAPGEDLDAVIDICVVFQQGFVRSTTPSCRRWCVRT